VYSLANVGKNEFSPAAMDPEVKIVYRLIINESHPGVQQLVEEYEHELEESIEAVRLCGGSVHKAMDYLARKDTDEREDIIEPTLNGLEEQNKE
jgi:hypothetical protein